MTLATLTRRFAQLAQQWEAYVIGHDERAAAKYLAAGADPAIPWQQWPAPVLALCAQLDTDPADLAAKLRDVLARRDDHVIRIVWIDGAIDREHNPPVLAIAPGMIDKLRPDGDQAPAAIPAHVDPPDAPQAHHEPPTAQVDYGDGPALRKARRLAYGHNRRR